MQIIEQQNIVRSDYGTVNGVPFFDPEKGYVPCGEARAAYKEIVDKALQEGTISRKEWELIMETYFADMSDKEQ